MPAEQTTGTATATTTTEAGAPSTEAAVPASLLSSTEEPAKPEQPAAAAATATTTEPAKPATEEPAKPAAETKLEGAPEKYEFKAPEGKEYDATVLEPFSEAAKAANLTQESAQKILETMAPKLVERQQAQVQAIQTGWLEASKADTEFGGDKLQENMAVAKKALDTFAPKNADGSASGFRKLLDDTGLGNNPEVLRLLVRVGKAIGEDGFVAGRGTGTGPAATAALMYDKTPAKT